MMQQQQDSFPIETLSTGNCAGDEMNDAWYQYQDAGDENVQSSSTIPIFSAMPSQLHPAVSLGMQRVSSCYFSIASSDNDSYLDSKIGCDQGEASSLGCGSDLENERSYGGEWNNSSVNLFYHDILMSVFTYLDATSLAAFSETARRPNFEVFYFLQLQLQRALLLLDREQSHSDEGHNLLAIAGVSHVSRLASLDSAEAEEVVNDYLQSNSTLRTMPLSHSLVYMHHFLQRNSAFCSQVMMVNQNSNTTSAKTFASAAFMLTLIGAAYMTTGTTDGAFDASFGTELPNMLFRFGFMGSLMGAARQISDTEQRQAMKKRAEKMAQCMQEQFSNNQSKGNFSLPSLMEMKRMINTMLSTGLGNDSKNQDKSISLVLPNPYDHLPEEKKEDDCSSSKISSSKQGLAQANDDDNKMPSGCVGAYSRAIQKATKRISQIIKQSRKNKFLALTEEEQQRTSFIFLDACSSDNSLNLVKEMIHTVDVDGFYNATDGQTTCAVSNAAFHGASQVIAYLCKGIADHNEGKDGGFCDVNMRDSNGWTAMHFAAGNDKVLAIRALASQPTANLQIEANNGYTPLQWANRLSNTEASETLKELLSEKQNKNHLSSEMTGPLTAIAQTVFSFMP